MLLILIQVLLGLDWILVGRSMVDDSEALPLQAGMEVNVRYWGAFLEVRLLIWIDWFCAWAVNCGLRFLVITVDCV